MDDEENKKPSFVKCNSCLLYGNCNDDLKDNDICVKYKTKIMLERDNREKLVRFHCLPNDKTSDWYKPWECNDPPENLQKIAEQLEVRPKDIFATIINDPFIADSKRPVETVILRHLNIIENPELAGKLVVVEAVVSSTSIAYLAPGEVEATYQDKEGEQYARQMIDEKSSQNIKLIGCNEDVKHRRLTRLFGISRKLTFKESKMRTVYWVRVRPPVFTLEKRGEKIVDEKGFEYKAYDIYVTSDNPIAFQPSRLIRIEGIPLPNPKTQKTTLLAYKVEFPEETVLFDVEKLQRLKTKLEGKNVKERLNWILNNFEKYSQIVGRRNLAETSFFGFFSPTVVRLDNELQKGWANVALCGDTTTGKSLTLRKIIMLLGAGTLITAETASTVGLTGAATQIEKEGWFVDWGFLVLCDRKLLAIDGAQKLSLKNWATLAEAERTGVITIVKAGKGSAYARTRQIKICNAVDKEADKYTTKSLANFLYPCQALPTIFDKTSIARLDLVAFADQRDVKPEEINRQFSGDYDKDLLLLSEALKWCWSDVAKVEFTSEATSTLLAEANNLYHMFFSEIAPIVSIDLKWKLARLSVALAYLTLSTVDFKKVSVTEEHVKEVVEFIKNEYSKAGLNTLAQETKFEALNLDDVEALINLIIYKTKNALDQNMIEDIFKFIVLQGRTTRDQLKTKFGLTETNQLRPLLAILSSEKMLRSGRGLYPTPKLIQTYKLLLIKVNKLSHSEKDGDKKIIFPSISFRVGKHDNLDKNKAASSPISSLLLKLEDLKSTHWADEFYGKHECCVCGYEKLTSWQAEDFYGNKLWICEDCQKEWQKLQEAK